MNLLSLEKMRKEKKEKMSNKSALEINIHKFLKQRIDQSFFQGATNCAAVAFQISLLEAQLASTFV